MANMHGTNNNDSITGTARSDDIEGRQGNDALFGLDGADDIHGGQGNDLVDGGTGDDRLHGGRGNDTLRGGDGDDTLWGNGGSNELSGGAGDDRLNGDDGAGRYWGGTGGDTLLGGAGDDSMFGESGNDLLRGGGGHDLLDGGDGDDTLSGGNGRDTLSGGDGNDRLLGGSGGNTIDGGGGSDTVEAGSGADSVRGGDGNDLLRGSQGNDMIDGGAGADTISGGQGSDLLIHRPTGETDMAVGGKGMDTVRIELTAVQWQSAAIRGGIEDLDAFIRANANPDLEAGEGRTYTSQSLGLTVNSVEGLSISVDGVIKQPGDKLADARADAFGEVRAGDQLSGAVTANDSVPDGVASVGVVTGPAAGTLSMGSDGQFSYNTGDAFRSLGEGETATQSFVYRVTDPQGDSDTATASFTVRGVNDGPTAGDDSVIGMEDQTQTIRYADLLGNDRDPDTNDTLSVTDAFNASGGTVSRGSGGIEFRPDANFTGTASFDYRVSDGHGGEDTATVQIFIAAVNDAPIAGDDSVAGEEDAARTYRAFDLLANDRDPDAGDSLRITAVGDATGGTVSLTASGDVLFTPTADFHGEATFTYTVSDRDGLTDQARVQINVASVNDAPIASDDTASGLAGQANIIDPASLLANDTDGDGDRLGIASVGNGHHGTVALDQAGQVVFTAEAGFSGTASFDYRVSDGHGGFDDATVRIEIADPGRLITGTPGPDSLVGGVGNDTILGLGSADTIVGGAGNDVMSGGSSAGDFSRMTRTLLSEQTVAAGARIGGSGAIDEDWAAVASSGGGSASKGAVAMHHFDGTSWRETQRIQPTDAQEGDYFGNEGALAIQGDTMVVGAPADDNILGTDAGSVFVYRRDGDTWREAARLTAPDGQADFQFGRSVAISGDNIIVGKGDNDAQGDFNGGAAYMFRRQGESWIPDGRLQHGIPSDVFGNKVAIYGDFAVVGATHDDSRGGNAGAVYVYHRGVNGWELDQKLTASGDSNPSGDSFGSDIAIFGNTIVVGSYSDEAAGPYLSGSAYVFDYNGTDWQQSQKLTATVPHQWHQLGFSVDIDGDRIVLGGQASEGEDRPGEVVMFERGGGSWTQSGVLTQGNGAPAQAFGYSVEISGGRVLAGAPMEGNNGSAYVFDAGGDAGDTFMVGGGSGNDTITDFEVGIDRLQLQGGTTIAGYRETDTNNDGRLDTIADLSDGGSVTMLGVRGLAPPQTTEAIVFRSQRSDANTDLWIMRPDGTGARQLTSGPGNDFDASISPDGTKVLFTRADSAGSNVWIKDLRTGSETPLTTSNADGSPDWSPDGTQIAFHSYRAGNGHIWVMNADGGGQHRLSSATTDTMPDWGADGYIYFQSTRDHRDLWDIWRISPTTGNASRVIGGNQEYQPAVSDDGTKLAWADIPGISIANIDGSGARGIPMGGSGEHALPDWSPDGQWVLYQDGGPSDLYKTNVSTGEVVRLTDTAGQDGYGDWGRVVRNPTIEDWFV